MPTRKATAVWEGGTKGTGHYEAGTGAFRGSYTFPSRFEEEPGSNPEELIAAAHAACLSMALTAGLESAGHTPRAIRAEAACTVDKVGDGFKITRMDLRVTGQVDGIDAAAFRSAAEEAKNNCPVSGALSGNVAVTVEAELE